MRLPWIKTAMAALARNTESVVVSGLSGGLAASVIVGFMLWANHVGWNPSVAAWVQAAAATLAMGVAIGVAALQGEQNRALQKDLAQADLRRRLEALLGLLQAANRSVWKCRRFLVRRPAGPSGDQVDVNLRLPFDDELARLDLVMAAIPLHELPSWDLAQAILTAREAIAGARTVGAAIYRSIEGGASPPNPLVPQIDLAKAAILQAKASAEHLLGRALPPIVTDFHQDPETTPVVDLAQLRAAAVESEGDFDDRPENSLRRAHK